MDPSLRSWFDARTFRMGDFSVAVLADRKAESGLTVSVVLPSRNEVATVGAMVEACRSLMPTIVDEIVVIDAGSSDGTAEAARAAGAVVHQDNDLSPEYGPVLGKGDALWRSLRVTNGDIVAFVDADIRNPSPTFVQGLVGPLLVHEAIAFVKAFYDRPVQLDEVLYPTGGGRVTELMARPLLNLFWPDLAGLVQPLAGEYAGRRDLLEQLPFFTGYGVELGLLVDTLERTGPMGIAQVDLEERVHRNQSLDALSRMAFGILQVAVHRLGEDVVRYVKPGVESRYVQFRRDERGVAPTVVDLTVVERPPLRSLTA